MPTFYTVELTNTYNEISRFKVAFAKSILDVVHDWECCVDVKHIEVVDGTTGEVMYFSDIKSGVLVKSEVSMDWNDEYYGK